MAEHRWASREVNTTHFYRNLFPNPIDNRFGHNVVKDPEVFVFIFDTPFYLRTTRNPGDILGTTCECGLDTQRLAHLVFDCPITEDWVEQICSDYGTSPPNLMEHKEIISIIKRLDDGFHTGGQMV